MARVTNTQKWRSDDALPDGTCCWWRARVYCSTGHSWGENTRTEAEADAFVAARRAECERLPEAPVIPPRPAPAPPSPSPTPMPVFPLPTPAPVPAPPGQNPPHATCATCQVDGTHPATPPATSPAGNQTFEQWWRQHGTTASIAGAAVLGVLLLGGGGRRR